MESEFAKTEQATAPIFYAAPTDRSAANAAFYYHPDGYETNRKELMGRHAAGESFLSAFVRYANYDKLYCYASSKQHYQHFLSKAKQSVQGSAACSWLPWANFQRLAEPGCLFMPSPTIHDLAWHRRHGDTRAYSLCGITHTTATQAVMDALGQLLIAPVQPWDALICTSQAVKSMVQELITNYGEYLQDRFNLPAPPQCEIQLPVIPLGVDCDSFDKPEPEREAIRGAWRTKLNIGDGDVAFLFVGRLSAYNKAHPVPMLIALQKAAANVSVRLHLILSGWFASQSQQNEFITAAKQCCPSVTVHIVDGRHPDARTKIWYAADVFTSLSDNIQETFGLTPVEAMAAGLPCVISDWNGYKETVRDGVDGYRIRTWMAPPGHATGLALSHAMFILNYDNYVGSQSQFTSVDVEAAAKAYARLASDAPLRTQMSVAAKKRAKDLFDWRAIIPQYQGLWSELAELRKSAKETATKLQAAPANPLRTDPTRLFRSYPSQSMRSSTMVAKDSSATEQLCRQLQSLAMNRFAEGIAGDTDEVASILGSLPQSFVRLESVLFQVPRPLQARYVLTLLWLSKFGWVHFR